MKIPLLKAFKYVAAIRHIFPKGDLGNEDFGL
jgi:hypothetical protein